LRERYTQSADPLRTQRRLELVALLLGLFICLQLVTGFIGLAVSTGPGAIEPAADSLRVPAVSTPAVVAAAGRNEIISRPLFWVGRRPVEVVAAIQDPDAARGGSVELKEVKLVGLFGGGDTAGAIVLVKGKKQRILRDESLEGWTLETIGPEEAVFTRGARREALGLERASVNGDAGAGAPERGAGKKPPAPIAVKTPPVMQKPVDPARSGEQAAEKAVENDKAAGQQGGSSLSLGPGAGQGRR
jgi:hypothetical protein